MIKKSSFDSWNKTGKSFVEGFAGRTAMVGGVLVHRGAPLLKGLGKALTLGVILKVAWVLLGVSLFSASATAFQRPSLDRQPSSVAFPYADEEDDYDDMLDEYKVYLEFVVGIGRSVNPRRARNVAKKFQILRSKDEKEAAKFLKGLKFEMDHRVQLKRASRNAMGSRSRATRLWVKRYLDEWETELDEYLFRAYVKKLVTRSED